MIMTTNADYSTDIVIIGAGPVGLFAIFEAGMLKMHCHVVDSLEAIGGQCTALYPEKPIYDIPAHPAILAQDLIDQLDKQTAPFNPTYHLGQQVTSISHNTHDNSWIVTTSKQTSIHCKAIIIAAGCGAFGPNRPPLQQLESYEGTSVFYLVKQKNDFAGKNIVIAGGGDSAVDWALALCDIAKSVTVVHRRNKFRCAPESQQKLENLSKEGKINLAVPYQLSEIRGDATRGILHEVIVTDLQGNAKSLPADILLPFFGLAMELGPIADWGLNLDKKHIVVNSTTMATSIPSIFAIGDIATYENKLKLILSGFSEAAMACYAARKVIHPDIDHHFEYSTTCGVPSTS